jgi:uncharacterized membrane protein YfcA
MQSNFLWLACFVLLSYTTQAMTGFGSTIIAVTLGANLYPIQFLLPILVPLDIVVNAFIVVRHQQHVDRQILFKTIIPIMGIGLLIGIAAFNILHGNLLKKLFGLLLPVIIIGIFVGEKLHTIINEHAFKIIVFVLLLGAGFSIIFT